MSNETATSIFFVFSILSAILFARANDRMWKIGIGGAFLVGTAIFAYSNLSGG